MDINRSRPNNVLLKTTSILSVILLFIILFSNLYMLIQNERVRELREKETNFEYFEKNLRRTGLMNRADIENFTEKYIHAFQDEILNVKRRQINFINIYNAYAPGDSNEFYYPGFKPFPGDDDPDQPRNSDKPNGGDKKPDIDPKTKRDTSSTRQGSEGKNPENPEEHDDNWVTLDKPNPNNHGARNKSRPNPTNSQFASEEHIHIPGGHTPESTTYNPSDNISFANIPEDTDVITHYVTPSVNSLRILRRGYTDRNLIDLISHFYQSNRDPQNTTIHVEKSKKLKRPDTLDIPNPHNANVSSLTIIEEVDDTDEPTEEEERISSGSIRILDDSYIKEQLEKDLSDDLMATNLETYTVEDNSSKLVPPAPANSTSSDDNAAARAIESVINILDEDINDEAYKMELMSVSAPLWVDGQTIGSILEQHPMRENDQAEKNPKNPFDTLSLLPKTMYLPVDESVEDALSVMGVFYENDDNVESIEMQVQYGTDEGDDRDDIDDKLD